MMNGTFDEFLFALRAFESGWDRDRYNAGVIIDAQLNQWAGGPVGAFFPQYSSWGQLSAAEWDQMSYRSMNSLGFVGYQFGEALLIDLGYYDDTVFYGAGAATNTWDGTWTGKNGVTSLADFMTKEKQDVAIQEAFGLNLRIIRDGLAQSGQSLEALLGTTASYVQNGQTVQVTLTLSGILAAAHLRGAYGTLALLQGGAVSTDEYGTSILQYIQQFGGYQTSSIGDIVSFFESRVTGDEGLGTPGGTPGTGGLPNSGPGEPSGDSGAPAVGTGTAGVTAQSATVTIDWAWGQTRDLTGFDPATGTIFIAWIGADALDISEVNGSVVIAVPSNNQQTTLVGVRLSDLSPQNFTIKDQTAEREVLGLIGPSPTSPGNGSSDGTGGDTGPGMGDHSGSGSETGPNAGSGNSSGGGGQGSGSGHGNGGTAPGGGHSSGGGHGAGGGHSHGGTMTMISLTTPSQTIDGFNPATDMLHIEPGVTADQFLIFEESGVALGITTRIAVTAADGTPLSTTILPGVRLADLSLANFSIADQGTLNEVATVLGQTITQPGQGGYPITYDNDGSNPTASTGASAAGGTKFRADVNADDIVGFNPAQDELDFGGTSVHGMILTKTPAGEIAIDSPWSDALQIVQGVTYQQTTIANYGVVGNEHFRQDIGAVVSWELGIGPREADTVYVRSHEYGVNEVVNGFDPATMKLSFLYFGTRERLSVEDTADGLVISSLPTGQSLTLTGVKLSDLAPGRVEFHHDQVMEDNLEVPFGFAQDTVTLVDRTVLLTPAAPPGETTDGAQIRDGVMTAPGGQSGEGTTGGDAGGGSSAGSDAGSSTGGGQAGGDAQGSGTGGGTSSPGAGGGTSGTPGGRLDITWAWAQKEVINGFDLSSDVIDFTSLTPDQVGISEVGADLVIEVLNNGGHTYTLTGIQAEDLTRANLDAASYNGIVDSIGGVADQLEFLGYDG